MAVSLQDKLEKELPKDCSIVLRAFTNAQDKDGRLDTEAPASKVKSGAEAKSEPRYTTHLYLASQHGRLILALELMLFNDKDFSTIYVSKVDTTGCHDTSTTGLSPISSLVKTIMQHFVSYCARHDRPVRIQLFAKSQPQYLFPYSSQNAKKHILSDAGLVKWWLKILDKIRVECSRDDAQARGYLFIPGFDQVSTRRFLPSDGRESWKVGYPYNPHDIASDVITRYPDDPKDRFLTQLKADKLEHQTTVEQFWEMMAFRQEMASGHTIGFITLDLKVDASQVELLDCAVSNKTYDRIAYEIKSESYASDSETLAATTKLTAAFDSIKGSKPLLVIGLRDTTSSSTTSQQVVNTLQPRKRQIHSANVLVPRKKISPT